MFYDPINIGYIAPNLFILLSANIITDWRQFFQSVIHFLFNIDGVLRGIYKEFYY